MHLYVWPDRFLYVGPSKATTLHRNHAAAWLVAYDRPVRVLIGGATEADATAIIEGDAAYVPSGVEYAMIDDHETIIVFYWEPESASFLRIASRIPNGPRGFQCNLKATGGCEILQRPETTLSEAERLLAPTLGAASESLPLPTPMDPRIVAVLGFLRESPQHYDSLDALAEKVHLSPSRLAHIFKLEVGVPVRRYVLWNKMRRALDFALAGDSLTTAALSAGFSDSAHLSRTVRAMLGIAPEFLFRHRSRLVIHR